ncbi:hypothetical protein BH10ACT7_BH10ACT7_12560 [soil metagenome]
MSGRYAMNHSSERPARHRSRSTIEPVDLRNPGDAFLQQEIDANRRTERWLIGKAAIALAIVAVLVAIRQVFFA